jgi:hypothetical protein
MREAFDEARPLTLRERWENLHESAQLIGSMAHLAKEEYRGNIADFPVTIMRSSVPKQEIAEQGLQDLDAMIQPGLTALLAIEARGQNTTAPALALWREVHAARQALLGLCAPEPA